MRTRKWVLEMNTGKECTLKHNVCLSFCLLMGLFIPACCPTHGKLPVPTLRPLYSPTDQELACLSNETFRKVVIDLEANCKANQAEMMKIIESQK